MHRSPRDNSRLASVTLVSTGLLGLLFAALSPTPVRAQSATYGALSGIVVDSIGHPLTDAAVRLLDRASGATRHAVTARDGRFRFGVLGPAVYDVSVEALGFRPVVYLGVSVGAGEVPVIRLDLRRERPPVVRADTLRAMGARVEPGTWMFARGYAELLGGRRRATDVASTSSVAGEDAVEGLPWRFADLVVDGARAGSVGAMGYAGNATQGAAAPSRALAAASVGGTGFDVEMGGTGVGINASSLRGGGATAMRVSAFGGSSDLGGAFAIGGPIQGDTAQAILGIDYQRSEISRPAWFPDDDAEGLAIVNSAANTYGTDLSSLRFPGSLAEERASGFGRLDWQVDDRYAIAGRVAGSRAIVRDLPISSGIASPLGARSEATAVQASIGVLSRLSKSFSSEIRFSGDMGDASTTATTFGEATFAGRGVSIGGNGDEPASDQRSAIRATAILHFNSGAHRLKVGGIIASHRIESQGPSVADGAFHFGDAADFDARLGAWRGLESHAGSGSFGMLERAFIVQDAWRVSDGLGVTFGLRFDGNRIPIGDLQPNAELAAATGLDNTALDDPRLRVAPRIGFRWELGDTRAWVLSGGAGVYNDLPDRRDLAEALTFDEGVEVRSAAGALASWPSAPRVGAAPLRGTTVAMLGPGFEGPRTRRMTLAVRRDLGAWTTYVRGTYRHTDFLARRRDLNIPAAPAGTDQYGRELYGTLQQVGSLVVATPGTNRRFSGFDAVTAIEATGFSEFTGVTVGVERVVPVGLSYGAHATYSRTVDDLAANLTPLPVAADGREWSEGTADTDAPLRVVAAAEWSATASGAFRLGVAYHGRSGTPFTPGFRPGVDANGDGIAGNDPAFIDAAVPGMGALLGTNTCLQSGSGALAERNACRGEWTHGLGLRATFRLASLATGPLDLVVDAIDVLPAERGRIDGALYLIDRTGTLVTNVGTGVTTIPLVANPNFGKIGADRSTGPLFRVALRIGQ